MNQRSFFWGCMPWLLVIGVVLLIRGLEALFGG